MSTTLRCLFFGILLTFSSVAHTQQPSQETDTATQDPSTPPPDGQTVPEPADAGAGDANDQRDRADEASDSHSKHGRALFWAQAILLILVLVVLPLLAASLTRRALPILNGKASDERYRLQIRGLGLPNGSLRGLMALLILGSAVNFFLFGQAVSGEYFGEVLAALSTLSVAVVSFYFAGRAATKSPEEQQSRTRGGENGQPDSSGGSGGGTDLATSRSIRAKEDV